MPHCSPPEPAPEAPSEASGGDLVGAGEGVCGLWVGIGGADTLKL